MPLAPGDQLGSYEILSLLGKGGMGEVYRAKDSVLKRDVALKVMPAALAHDPERLARFQREAEVLASLDHPNIGPIFGIAESNSTRALVLALIEGPTLADRIRSAPIPLDESLRIARQIIDALEYAHDRGVIHRDLKPANVKVTPEGAVKVLDFGLAKVLEDDRPLPDSENSPTLTLGHTRAGTILGTAAYMSPEQAVGNPTDRRSDIFSFGAVLYELLTGQRAFKGETAGHTLAAVVKEDPDWSALPAGTPKRVADLLRRCLAKDRKQRMQAIGEARIVLEGSLEDPAPVVTTRASNRWLPLIAAAASATIALAAAWLWLRPEPPPPAQVMRFTFATDGGFPDISPDGSQVVYTLNRQLYMRTLGDFVARTITGGEGSNIGTVFSPDGKWIAFLAPGTGGRSLRKVPVEGGTPQILADGLINNSPPLLSWGTDDGILISPAGTEVLRIPASGGKPETIAKEINNYAQLLPTGKLLLSGRGGARIFDRASSKSTVVLPNTGYVRYAPTEVAPGVGHLVHWENGTLFATPFDPVAMAVRGPSVPVEAGISGDVTIAMWSFSANGTLVYRAGDVLNRNLSSLIWVNRKGDEEEIPLPSQTYGVSPKVSPDGDRVSVNIQDQNWIYDLKRNTQTRLVTPPSGFGVWTPDGNHLMHIIPGEQNSALFSSPADGGAKPTLLAEDRAQLVLGGSVSKNGFLPGLRRTPTGAEFWTYHLDQKGAKIETLLKVETQVENAQLSPDGRWASYRSTESGRPEIYAVPFPGPGPRAIISSGGGSTARWHPNGKELFYTDNTKFYSVDVDTTDPTLKLGAPKLLFEKPQTTYAGWDVAPDGRFLMTKRVPTKDAPTAELHVVLNWFEDLRRKAPVAK